MFLPSLVVIIGLVWLLNNLGYIPGSTWDFILPSAVILAGLSMFNKKGCAWCKHQDQNK
jgi:hypothetical protein